MAAYTSHLINLPSNEYLIGGYGSQCAAQLEESFLFVSDSLTKRRHELVQLSNSRGSGPRREQKVWFNLKDYRAKKGAITKKEELPIMATGRADQTAVFWISDRKMNLVLVRKPAIQGHNDGRKPQVHVINDRCAAIPVAHDIRLE